MKYNATIYYTMKETHPDIKYAKDWSKAKVYSYSDTYTFDPSVWEDDEDAMMDYMLKDLSLVAGGGYNTDHIEHVRCVYERK